MAAILAAAACCPGWPAPARTGFARPARPLRARLAAWRLAAAASLIVASPQLIAMAQQALSGGAAVGAHVLAHTGKSYGVGLFDLFAPTQRVEHFGLKAWPRRRPGPTGASARACPCSAWC